MATLSSQAAEAGLPEGVDPASVSPVQALSSLPEGVDPASVSPVQAAAPQTGWAAVSQGVMDASEQAMSMPGSSYVKDIALGAAKDVTGPAELIPGLHPYAAKASRYLDSNIEHPWAGLVGEALPFVFGAGEAGTAAKAIKPIGKAAEWLFPEILGEGVVPAAKRVGQGALKGALKAGAGGVGIGALSATGEEDYGQMAREKMHAAEIGGATGGVAGGVLSGGGEAWRGFKNFLGGNAAREVGAAHGAAAGEAEKVKTGATETKTEAGSEEARLDADLQARRAELEQIREQQEKLGTDLGASMNERVRNAENLARESGLPLDQARMFAVEQEARVTEAEHAANQLAQEFAAAGGKMSRKEFGDKLQKAMDDIQTKYEGSREEQSGYKAVMAREEENYVDTGSVVSYIRSNLKKISDLSPTRTLLAKIKRDVQKITFDAEGKPRIASESILAKADSTRKMIDSIIRTNLIRFEDGTSAPAGEAVHYVRDIRSKLIDAMREASPDWGAAFKKFKDLSRPLDIFERQGPFAGLTKDDPLSGEYKVLQADVVGRVLQKTAKGSNAFSEIVAELPELRQAALDFFRRELYGPDGLEEVVSAKKIRDFLVNNGEALEQTGLYKYFENVKIKMEGAENKVSEAKKVSDTMNQKVKGMEGVDKLLKKARESGELSEKVLTKYGIFLSEMEKPGLSMTGKMSEAGKVFKALREDGHITSDQYNAYLKQVADAGAAATTAEQRIKMIKKVVALAFLSFGSGVVGRLGFDAYKLLWSTPLEHGR